MTEQQVFFAMLALVAFLIGLSKGGLGGTLGALAAPLMALVMPADNALGLLMPLLMVGDVFAVIFYWRQWNSRLALWLIPGAFVGVILGTVVIIDAPTALLETILGVVILFFVVYKLFEERILGALNYQPRNWHSLAAGGVAGLASTLAHNGGPPISIYLLIQDLTPVVFVATSAIFFFVLNWIKMPFYVYAGVFDLGLMRNVLWVLPIEIAGVFLGRWMASRISRRAFERIIIVLLMLTAILLIFKPGTGTTAPDRSALAGPVPGQALMRLGKGDINAIGLSPDGGALAVGGETGLFLYQTGDLRSMWQTASASPVQTVALSTDGRLLAAGLKSGVTDLVDASNGQLLMSLPPELQEQSVTSLAWTPGVQGTHELALGYNDGSVRLMAVSGQSPTIETFEDGPFPRLSAAVSSLAFDPSGHVLATGDREGGIGLWDVQRGEDAGELKGHQTNAAVTQLQWLADGAHLLSGSDDGQVFSWDTAAQQGQQEFRNHKGRILALAELADHRHVLVDGAGSLIVGKAASADPDETVSGFTDAPALAAWSNEGRVLAASDKAGDLQIWRSENGPASDLGAQAAPHSPDGAQATALAASPDGKQIASGLGAKVLVWDAATGALLRTLEGHRRQVAALAYSPDGTTLASGGWDGAVVLWDVKSGDKQRTLSGHKRDVGGLAWSPDGKRLASTGTLDNQVILWNPATGQPEASLTGTDQGVWGVAWSPDGKTLAVSTSLADVMLWDVSKPSLSAAPDDVLRGHSNWVSTLAWSPDGTKLASSGADRLVIVWDVPNRQRFQSLTGHEGVVRAVAFSPDGKALATSGLDQQVLVWLVEKGVKERLRTFAGHTGPVDALAWLPDGSRLASASEDGTVLIWGFEQP